MTLTQLEYLLAVHRLKSFNKAARDCNVTQPSLSAQIAKLEDELGVVLFDRSRSPVITTEAGIEVTRQAQVILSEVSRLTDLVHEIKGQVRGEFKIGVIPTLAPFLLPLCLPSLNKNYPDLMLEVSEMPTHELVRKLHDGQVDAGLLSTPREAPDTLLERVLFYEPLYVYVGDESPLKQKKELQLKDLPADRIVLLDEVHCLRDQVMEFCRIKEEVPSSHRTHFVVGSILTLMKLVDPGDGFTIIPGLATQQMSPADIKKRIRQLRAPVPVRKVSLVYHRAHVKRSKIEALRDAIIHHLPKDIPKQLGSGLKPLNPNAKRFTE